MTKVKICGITNLEDARLALDLGADELGFNFYVDSKRYIERRDAREIAMGLPADFRKVGVFVNETIESILQTVDLVGLDAIQLHGDERYEFVTMLHRATEKEIIKAVRVSTESDLTYAMDFDAHCILLDSFSKSEYGGTGEQFDWTFAKHADVMFPYLYLAGGLTSENVAEAIRTVRPYAVDVASGVESSPGRKDVEKMKRFIEAVRNAG